MPVSYQTIKSLQYVEDAVHKLHGYLQACHYSGYDPYDGLESRVFRATPLKRLKAARLAWIQLMKRSPLNFRPLLLVPRSRNPKGIALCASALLKLSRAWGNPNYVHEARSLLDWLISHQTHGYSGCSWGYNFDWQSREFFAPKGTPNAICTIFVANAFLDAFEQLGDHQYLELAQRGCDFILNHLVAESGDELYIRYVPNADAQVHNVNFLGAALLARTCSHAQEDQLLKAARKAVTFSIRRQNADGSWCYGESPDQRWIDNFHTGFNLVALSRYRWYTADPSFDEALRCGYDFWDQNFFMSDGTPKYYHDKLYPLDIHCAAQGILTYLEFAARDEEGLTKAQRIASWALQHMRSPQGFFYHQKHRWYTIRIPYIRWSQAWMFYALSTLLAHRS